MKKFHTFYPRNFDSFWCGLFLFCIKVRTVKFFVTSSGERFHFWEFTVPVEGGNASKRLWKELMQMREIRVEKPHWGNLFKDGFLGPYFVTTVDIDDTGKLQYHTRPFNFVQVLENGNNTCQPYKTIQSYKPDKKRKFTNFHFMEAGFQNSLFSLSSGNRHLWNFSNFFEFFWIFFFWKFF